MSWHAVNGDDSVWADAAVQIDSVAQTYQRRRLDLYRVAQKRWPSSPFWRRFRETGSPGTFW